MKLVVLVEGWLEFVALTDLTGFELGVLHLLSVEVELRAVLMLMVLFSLCISQIL